MGKVNLKVYASDAAEHFQVCAGDISPDGSILALTTYRRLWQFRNFTGDQFFNGTNAFVNFSGTGSDSITRAYEGVAFHNNRYLTLGVDGGNGRISGLDLDSIALLVKNTNHTGPGSLRHAIAAASEGDTIRFRNAVVNDTITVSTPLTVTRDINILQSASQPVFIKGIATHVLAILPGADVRLTGIRIIGGNAPYQCIINQGSLVMENVILHKSQ